MTTSPGQATAQRAFTEATLHRYTLRSYRRFLRESKTDGVMLAWEAHIEREIVNFGRRFPGTDQASAVRDSLRFSLIPGAVQQALREGTNLLPRRPAQAFGEESMERWLRTAATELQNAESLKELAGEGFTHKKWISHHDSKVRPSHLAANGQVVPTSATFSVGGYPLMYPADPSAPPHERENCRCVLVAVGKPSGGSGQE